MKNDYNEIPITDICQLKSIFHSREISITKKVENNDEAHIGSKLTVGVDVASPGATSKDIHVGTSKTLDMLFEEEMGYFLNSENIKEFHKKITTEQPKEDPVEEITDESVENPEAPYPDTEDAF